MTEGINQLSMKLREMGLYYPPELIKKIYKQSGGQELKNIQKAWREHKLNIRRLKTKILKNTFIDQDNLKEVLEILQSMNKLSKYSLKQEYFVDYMLRIYQYLYTTEYESIPNTRIANLKTKVSNKFLDVVNKTLNTNYQDPLDEDLKYDLLRLFNETTRSTRFGTLRPEVRELSGTILGSKLSEDNIREINKYLILNDILPKFVRQSRFFLTTKRNFLLELNERYDGNYDVYPFNIAEPDTLEYIETAYLTLNTLDLNNPDVIQFLAEMRDEIRESVRGNILKHFPNNSKEVFTATKSIMLFRKLLTNLGRRAMLE